MPSFVSDLLAKHSDPLPNKYIVSKKKKMKLSENFMMHTTSYEEIKVDSEIDNIRCWPKEAKRPWWILMSISAY